MRVLVVDDDPGARAIVRRVVAKALHFETEEASNGLECLELLERKPFALVVLDLQMPLVGGIEALRAIRATASLAHLPVVVLTGGADEDHVRQALTFGVAAYLTKPIDPDQLAARLVQVGASLLPPGHNPGQPGDTLAIVCGPDEDFRRRVVQLLNDDFEARDVEGLDDLLRLLETPNESWRTRIVVCSLEHTRPADQQVVDAIRALPSGGTITLFAAVPRDEVGAAKRSGLWDGVLSSAMPPTMFVSQFTRLQGTASVGRRVGDDDDILAAG
ncbi:MAG: response regulator [Acidobacteria bacterium]|nr:response regulator [Acidobacteriota bacterium]